MCINYMKHIHGVVAHFLTINVMANTLFDITLPPCNCMVSLFMYLFVNAYLILMECIPLTNLQPACCIPFHLMEMVMERFTCKCIVCATLLPFPLVNTNALPIDADCEVCSDHHKWTLSVGLIIRDLIQ